MFVLKLLYNLHPEIFKLLKECALKHLSSDLLKTGGVKRGKSFAEVRSRVLFGCSPPITAIKIDFGLPETRIDPSESGTQMGGTELQQKLG